MPTANNPSPIAQASLTVSLGGAKCWILSTEAFGATVIAQFTNLDTQHPAFRTQLLQLWDRHARSAVHRRFVGTQADHRPIGARRGIGESRLFAEHGLEEIVD